MNEWNWTLLGLAILGGIFFVSVVLALYWAVRTGQFDNMDRGSRVIFDDEEPEGEQTDFFPREADKAKRKINEAEQKRRSEDDDDLIKG